MFVAYLLEEWLDYCACDVAVEVNDVLSCLALFSLSSAHDFGEFALELDALIFEPGALFIRELAVLLWVHDFSVVCGCDDESGRRAAESEAGGFDLLFEFLELLVAFVPESPEDVVALFVVFLTLEGGHDVSDHLADERVHVTEPLGALAGREAECLGNAWVGEAVHVAPVLGRRLLLAAFAEELAGD